VKTSIVVPAYNAEKFLADLIQSVQRQTIPDWELVIVDDGSGDQTAAVGYAFARSDGRVRVVHQARGGVDAARNAGFAATDVQSNFLVFMDADDVWEPDALETLRDALETHPLAVGVYGQAYHMDAEGKPWGGEKSPLGPAGVEETRFDHLVVTSSLPPGAFLVRRWACETAGLFDAAALGCDDWDFWLRVGLCGSFFSVPRLIIGYRRHETNMTHHNRLVEAGHRRLMQKIESYRLAREVAAGGTGE